MNKRKIFHRGNRSQKLLSSCLQSRFSAGSGFPLPSSQRQREKSFFSASSASLRCTVAV